MTEPRMVQPEEAEKWANDRFAPQVVRDLAYTVCKLREFAAINAQAYDEIQIERNQLSEALKKAEQQRDIEAAWARWPK
jgi:hypothetical protein